MKHHLWNMFTTIKNGQLAKKSVVVQARKNICESFLKILWDEGYILGYKVPQSNTHDLQIFLKYTHNGNPVINSLKAVSKPGKRVYYSAKQVWKMDSSKAFIIFSTNKGLKTLIQCKKEKLGGEPFLSIS